MFIKTKNIHHTNDSISILKLDEPCVIICNKPAEIEKIGVKKVINS